MTNPSAQTFDQRFSTPDPLALPEVVAQYLALELQHSKSETPAKAREIFPARFLPAAIYPHIDTPEMAAKRVITTEGQLRLIVTKDDVKSAERIRALRNPADDEKASNMAHFLVQAETALVEKSKPLDPSQGLKAIAFAKDREVSSAYLDLDKLAALGRDPKNAVQLFVMLKQAIQDTREIGVGYDRKRAQMNKDATKVRKDRDGAGR